jgi:hypothetical protein
MFTWADGVPDDRKAKVAEELDALPGLIPEIQNYEHGPDAGLSEGNYDYCAVADFADEDAYRVYAGHAEHQRVIADHIRPIITGRTAVQYRVDG